VTYPARAELTCADPDAIGTKDRITPGSISQRLLVSLQEVEHLGVVLFRLFVGRPMAAAVE